MIDQFAIWTRYERPTGTIVRHVFGPYPTRSKAQAELKRMLRRTQDEARGHFDMGALEAHVTKMVGDEPE